MFSLCGGFGFWDAFVGNMSLPDDFFLSEFVWVVFEQLELDLRNGLGLSVCGWLFGYCSWTVLCFAYECGSVVHQTPNTMLSGGLNEGRFLHRCVVPDCKKSNE